MENELYYIQTKGFVGNCLLWWAPERRGYVCDLDLAGKYTKEEAESIVKDRPEKDKMHLCSEVDILAIRHIASSNRRFHIK